MSDDENDRFKNVDRAVDRVREELNDAVEGTRHAGTRASSEVREAIDSLEERVKRLRRRDKEE